MTPALRPVLSCLALCLGSAPVRTLELHVVDFNEGPGFDFAEISEAVAAASSGDTILVRGGGYDPFEIAGISLTVVEEAGENARVGGTVTVRDLAPGQRVVLRGLRTSAVVGGPGLHVVDCLGSVWVEDCRWVGDTPLSSPGVAGVLVEGSTRVVLSRVSADGDRGNGGGAIGQPGGPGLDAIESNLFVWGGAFVGKLGTGGDEGGGYGGPGIEVDGGSLWASGARLVGGDGGWADSDEDIFGGGGTICNPPGEGGHGILGYDFQGTSALLLRTRANLYNPGLGGINMEPICPPASDGLPVATWFGTGTWQDLPGAAVGLVAESPVRPGEDVALTVSGPPGALAVAVLALSEFDLYLSAGSGVLHLLPPLALVPAGTLSPEGEIAVRVQAPPLPPGTEALTLFGQGLVASGLGAPLLGAPSAVTLVDTPLRAAPGRPR